MVCTLISTFWFLFYSLVRLQWSRVDIYDVYVSTGRGRQSSEVSLHILVTMLHKLAPAVKSMNFFSLWQLIYFVLPFSLCRILESGKGTDQYSKSSSNTVSIDELDKLFYNSCWWCCLKNELNSYICTITALNYFAITEKWNLI